MTSPAEDSDHPGDASVLAEYYRIRGDGPEHMMDAAAAAYLALTLDGMDTLLVARRPRAAPHAILEIPFVRLSPIRQ